MTQAKLFDYDEKEDYYEDEEEVKTPRKPGQAPDGGWGWVVCVGAFLCCLLVQGLLYSFDVLKEDIATFYNVPLTSLESTNMLMLIFSLLGGKAGLPVCDNSTLTINVFHWGAKTVRHKKIVKMQVKNLRALG